MAARHRQWRVGNTANYRNDFAFTRPTFGPAEATMIPQHPAVGIDLGTTYSVVAYIDNTGRPVSIPNELGDVLTPSATLCG